jgi:hypothetical protein
MKIRATGLMARDLDGEVVLLDLLGSRYMTLNESGALLFHRLQDGATRADLIACLVGAYDLPEDDAATDVDEFVATLAEASLLET